MAARGSDSIRVRLEFEYPPPALVGCRACWLLVDLSRWRVVADLEGAVRERFGFGRSSVVHLHVDDCYLPHTESVRVLRDDDRVSVKVEYLDLVNGDSRSPEKRHKSHKKRPRPTEEHQPEENEVSEGRKKKRRAEKQEVTQASVDGKKQKLQGKSKEKKKKKTKKKHKSAESTKNTPVRVDQPVKTKVKTKKSPVAQHASSSDSSSSSSSEEEEAPQKPAPRTPSNTPASSRKQNPTKQRPPPSSSSETSSDEAASSNPPSQKQPSTSTTNNPRPNEALAPQPTPPAEPPGGCAQTGASAAREQPSKTCTSGSEEEIEFVIRKPVHPPGFGMGGPSSRREFGRRGKNGRDGAMQRGRGGNRGGFRGQNSTFEDDGSTKPSYQTDSLTNTSVVLQNKPENAAPKDYSSMPLLAAPPQVGQRIAFKLLELTENYTPEVSDYKEGKIISFDHATTQIELELQAVSQAPVEPGKFDLVYQNADGTERVEYAVSRDARVVERWDCLLEPRLII